MKKFIIENGILKKYQGTEPDVLVPEGVRVINHFAFERAREMLRITLPASLAEIRDVAFSGCDALEEIRLAPENPHLVLRDGVVYDREMKTLLLYPTGRKEDSYTVPPGVVELSMSSLPKHSGFHLHLTGDVQSMGYGEGGSMVIHAPAGSFAEQFARRRIDHSCTYVEEGVPVAPDESALRKERQLKDWRNYFYFLIREGEISILSYLRGSKVVWLPDRLGKYPVAQVSPSAFPPDTAVLCGQELFRKLCQENQNATVRTFLTNPERFSPEERAYLLPYFKKHRMLYLEQYIKDEDYPALNAAFDAIPKASDLTEKCLEIAARLGMSQVNFFLLQKQQERNGGIL